MNQKKKKNRKRKKRYKKKLNKLQSDVFVKKNFRTKRKKINCLDCNNQGCKKCYTKYPCGTSIITKPPGNFYNDIKSCFYCGFFIDYCKCK